LAATDPSSPHRVGRGMPISLGANAKAFPTVTSKVSPVADGTPFGALCPFWSTILIDEGPRLWRRAAPGSRTRPWCYSGSSSWSRSCSRRWRSSRRRARRSCRGRSRRGRCSRSRRGSCGGSRGRRCSSSRGGRRCCRRSRSRRGCWSRCCGWCRRWCYCRRGCWSRRPSWYLKSIDFIVIRNVDASSSSDTRIKAVRARH
jgi:hypothetical protein